MEYKMGSFLDSKLVGIGARLCAIVVVVYQSDPNPTTTKPLYISFLKNFIPSDSGSPEPKCVFTHSDLRPANIRVVERDGKWVISSIIDWEFSGFYPDYWESLKITNTMGQWEDSDWFHYLPESLSPIHNARRWLLGRIWDGLVK